MFKGKSFGHFFGQGNLFPLGTSMSRPMWKVPFLYIKQRTYNCWQIKKLGHWNLSLSWKWREWTLNKLKCSSAHSTNMDLPGEIEHTKSDNSQTIYDKTTLTTTSVVTRPWNKTKSSATTGYKQSFGQWLSSFLLTSHHPSNSGPARGSQLCFLKHIRCPLLVSWTPASPKSFQKTLPENFFVLL